VAAPQRAGLHRTTPRHGQLPQRRTGPLHRRVRRPAGEVAPFFARFGFAQEALLASQSVAADLQPALAELATSDPQGYEAAIEALLEVASDPSILGMSSHLLYVGRRV
jgi:hypothetical protein